MLKSKSFDGFGIKLLPLETAAQLRVHNELDGSSERSGNRRVQTHQETDERLVVLGNAVVFRFRLGEGGIENTIEHLPLLVSEQRAQ